MEALRVIWSTWRDVNRERVCEDDTRRCDAEWIHLDPLLFYEVIIGIPEIAIAPRRKGLGENIFI